MILRLRRHEPLRDGDRQCPVVRFGSDSVDRCSGRAEPLHDLHSASGIDPDGEVYGVAWITRAALPPPEPEPIAGAILALGFATDETTARYWLAQCARRGADQTLLAELERLWLEQQRDSVQYLHSTPTPREEPRP